MTPEVQAALVPLLTGKPERPLLYAYTDQSLSRAFRRLRDRLGLASDVTLHALRHDAAQALADEGIDPLTVKAMLGHRTLYLTDFYSKNAQRKRQKAAAAQFLATRSTQ
jgi:site-specific recombinase XerD